MARGFIFNIAMVRGFCSSHRFGQGGGMGGGHGGMDGSDSHKAPSASYSGASCHPSWTIPRRTGANTSKPIPIATKLSTYRSRPAFTCSTTARSPSVPGTFTSRCP